MEEPLWLKILLPLAISGLTGVTGYFASKIERSVQRSRKERLYALREARAGKNAVYELRMELESRGIIPVKLKFPSPHPTDFAEDDAG